MMLKKLKSINIGSAFVNSVFFNIIMEVSLVCTVLSIVYHELHYMVVIGSITGVLWLVMLTMLYRYKKSSMTREEHDAIIRELERIAGTVRETSEITNSAAGMVDTINEKQNVMIQAQKDAMEFIERKMIVVAIRNGYAETEEVPDDLNV